MLDYDRYLVIAPHPDDEVLGMGGTIKKLTEMGKEVAILYISGHYPPLYPNHVGVAIETECMKSLRILGVTNFRFFRLPPTNIALDGIASLNSLIYDFVTEFKPEVVFGPFTDRHVDHKQVFEAMMVATRPLSSLSPKIVASYEVVSETHWLSPSAESIFQPTHYVDITAIMLFKLKAMGCFVSQIQPTPCARSLEALDALAVFRGSCCGVERAEGFVVHRYLC